MCSLYLWEYFLLNSLLSAIELVINKKKRKKRKDKQRYLELAQVSPEHFACIWNSSYFTEKNKECTSGNHDFGLDSSTYFYPTKISVLIRKNYNKSTNSALTTMLRNYNKSTNSALTTNCEITTRVQTLHLQPCCETNIETKCTH